MTSLATQTVALLLGITSAAALIGCTGGCEPSGCPSPVAMHDLCIRAGACTLDGAPAPCLRDNCPMLFPKRGQHVVVSLAGVDLQRVRALFVEYGNGGASPDPNPVYPDAKNAIVLL